MSPEPPAVNFEREALSYENTVRRYLDWENTFLFALKNSYIPVFFLLSIMPIIPGTLYAILFFIYPAISFWLLWLWSFGISLFSLILVNLICKKAPREIEEVKRLSVYSYLIHQELNKHANTSDGTMLEVPRKLNSKLRKLWLRTFIVNDTLRVVTLPEKGAANFVFGNGVICKMTSISTLAKFQKCLPLFKLDEDATTFFQTLELVDSRIMKQFESGGRTFKEFIDAYLYFSRFCYAMRGPQTSLEELRASLDPLVNIVSKLPDYVAEEKKPKKDIFELIGIGFSWLYHHTWNASHKAVRFITWLLPLGSVSVFGVKYIAERYFTVGFQANAVALLAIAATVSVSSAVFLSGKDGK